MKSFLIIFLAASAVFSCGQSLIYEQTSRSIIVAGLFPSGTTEYGDEVTFGPGSRDVTQIEIPFYMAPSGNQNPTFTVSFFIREMDGNSPSSTTLWSDSQVVNPHGSAGNVTPFTVTMNVSGVTVPDTAYVGFTADLGSNPPPWLGFGMGGAATVGSSDPSFYWTLDGGVATQSSLGTDNNIQMSVYAVPEPVSLAGLGMGLAALIRRRRRKK